MYKLYTFLKGSSYFIVRHVCFEKFPFCETLYSMAVYCCKTRKRKVDQYHVITYKFYYVYHVITRYVRYYDVRTYHINDILFIML